MGPQVFDPQPGWDKAKLGDVTAVWYQRKITVPRQWSGRRITLQTDYINSHAVVYLDGKRTGEMRYPGGELDLTKRVTPRRKQVLSVLVLAMPLKSVMRAFNDSASARQVEGKVKRRGLCGDIYLAGTPAGPRVTNVKVDTSVRRWQITFDAALTALDPESRYILRAQIEGRDFYLNGTRLYLSAIPLDNGQLGPASASYDGTRATLQRFKSFGINYVYTHNYGCEPGSHISFEEVLRAADDEGMLLSFSQPHFGHYEWTAPDADRANGYAQHAEFYVRVAQNHASVVCYSTSHNSTGYAEDMNPDMIDGIQNPRDAWALRNAGRALRAEAIIKRFDSSRIVYHHASGNLGWMHLINFYANWAPIQEMSDWFEHWATLGVKPVFTCEYSVPFLWDWSMYRGWYKGKREFGNVVAPWEFCVAEWSAQFLGDRSYRILEEEKANLRWEAEQFRKGSRLAAL